jgi:hypothetical protein
VVDFPNQAVAFIQAGFSFAVPVRAYAIIDEPTQADTHLSYVSLARAYPNQMQPNLMQVNLDRQSLSCQF